MLLSEAGNFIYLKTHKTASTTTELALEPFCAPPNHKVLLRNKDPLITDYGIVGARSGGPKRRRRSDFFWNHMGTEQIIKRIGFEKFMTYKRVTSVRNPFKKYTSQFYFRYHLNKKLNPPTTLTETREAFEKFLLSPESKTWACRKHKIISKVLHFGASSNIPMYPGNDDYIVKYKGNLVATHFIKCESLEEDLKEFCKISSLSPELLNIGNYRDNSPIKKYNHYELFHDNKTLVSRVIDLEGWVFDAVGYSKDPEQA